MFFDSMFWTTGQIGYYLLGKQIYGFNDENDGSNDLEGYNQLDGHNHFLD